MKATLALLALLAIASAKPGVTKFKHPIKTVHSKHIPHIIGGDEAKPHSIPYQVSLRAQDSNNNAWLCGGSLISQNYVVTAATCIQGADSVEVTLGAHKLSENEDTQVKLTSSDLTPHEDYDVNTLENDIGVIKLPESVALSDAIQPIAIASDASQDYAGDLATISGWGATQSDDPDISDVLNVAQTEVITIQACQSVYGSIVKPTNLCTSGNGACYGDAGGPLVADGQLIGVTSFTSFDCGQYPSGFTKVASYSDWLKANTDV